MIPDEFLPPCSREAEQSLIGGLLLDNRAFDRIAGRVEPSDCYDDAHRKILSAILMLLDTGKSADVVSVFEVLQRSGEADRVGGLAYLGEIANNTPSAANIVRYAEIVSEKATLRALLAAASQIHGIAIAADGGSTADRVANAAECIAAVVESGIRTRSEPVEIGECLNEALEAMEAAHEGRGVVRYKSGLADLDPLLYDLTPGALVIVAGRPGMGKSSLALQIAEQVSNDGQPGAVAFFSLEMPRKQVTFRLLSQVSGIELTRLIDAKSLTESDYERISAATGQLFARKIAIDESGGLRVSDLRARCNTIRRKAGGLKMIVVDYLQLMTGTGDNRTQEIGSISRGLKAMAKEFGVPIMALSQLNRSLEQRANKRPIMSDLRESGDIEQDADLILFAYRDEVYDPYSVDRGTAEIIIGKQRNGPTGDCRVSWIGPRAMFANLNHADYAQQQRAEKPKLKTRGME